MSADEGAREQQTLASGYSSTRSRSIKDNGPNLTILMNSQNIKENSNSENFLLLKNSFLKINYFAVQI